MPSGIWNRGPIIGTEATALVRLADLSGLGREEPISFSHEITWFLASSSSVEFRHGGEVVHLVSRYTDGGDRFLSSMRQAHRDALSAAARFRVEDASTAEVALCVTLSRQPGLSNVHRDNAFSPDYHEPPGSWWLDTPATRDWVNPGIKRKLESPTRLEASPIFQADVWSTHGGLLPCGLEGLQQAIEQALGRTADGLVDFPALADGTSPSSQAKAPGLR
jgi:hypothetical protein